MKLLLVDTKERLKMLEATKDRLTTEWGFDVSKLSWGDQKTDAPDPGKVIRACQGMDVALIHFGSIPRGEAADMLGQIKAATTAKIIVNSASPILFEKADTIISVPFFSEQLVATINSLAG